MTRRKPILDGRTYMRVGSILDRQDRHLSDRRRHATATGNQLINWMAEIKRDTSEQNDWNKPGNLADFFPLYESWRFDWLDVAQMIRDADQILEYPMVDKDPIDTLDFRPRHARRRRRASDVSARLERRGAGGDRRAHARRSAAASSAIRATHSRPMRPRGPRPAAKVVRTNREHPPDFINIKVEELVGDRPFDDLDKYITQDELRALSENYKRIAGFALTDVSGR